MQCHAKHRNGKVWNKYFHWNNYLRSGWNFNIWLPSNMIEMVTDDEEYNAIEIKRLFKEDRIWWDWNFKNVGAKYTVHGLLQLAICRPTLTYYESAKFWAPIWSHNLKNTNHFQILPMHASKSYVNSENLEGYKVKLEKK